jgi:hypothetical protein
MVLVLIEVGVLIAMLYFDCWTKSSDNFNSNGWTLKMQSWMCITIIAIICLHLLIQIWNLKELLMPNLEEKFSLTIQGSHEHVPARSRRTVIGITVQDGDVIQYNENPEGILVYFRKFKESASTTGPYRQPCLVPLKGWFPFIHTLIFVALFICCLFEFIYKEGQGSIFGILIVCVILQPLVMFASYYSSEDCGFCCLLSYTRWFKHTGAYTQLVQKRIQTKLLHEVQTWQQEGEQLSIATNTQVLLHRLLAQEHDQLFKEVFPGYHIHNEGVSFTLSAQEINSLNTYAKKIEETPEQVV